MLAWHAPTTFTQGLILGAGIVTTIAAIALLTAQATGTAHLTAGSTAEQWTAQELRQLRAHGWRIINHFQLEDFDIDHVLVGPGGVIAVETKWSHRDWRTRQSRPWLQAAVEQAQANARTLRLWLRTHGATDVTPVMFCWSAHQPDREPPPTEPGQIRTTQLIYGTQAAAAWRQHLTHRGSTETILDQHQIDRIREVLDQQIRRRDLTTAQTTPPPPTLNQIYWTLLGTLAAFALGLLANLQTYTATKSWTIWTTATITQAAAGLAALRTPTTRRYTASWLTAVITGIALAAADALAPHL